MKNPFKRTKPQDFTAQEDLKNSIGDDKAERGIPDLSVAGAQTSKSMNHLAMIGGAIFALGLVIAGLMIYFSGDDIETADEKPTLDMVENSQSHDFAKEQADILAQTAAAEQMTAASAPEAVPEPTASAPEPLVQAQPEPEPVAVAEDDKERPPTPAERRLMGNVLLSNESFALASTGSDNRANTAQTANTDTYTPNFNDGSASPSTGQESASLSQLLTPTVTSSAQASLMQNPTYLLSKGTTIPCTLDTRIITTHPGFTRCIVSQDVYSANGKTLLLERGSKVVGEQTAALLQGQARVFVLWNEVTTPLGVKVSLASPSSGALGAAGQAARVDNHFFQRFSGAILLSLISDIGEAYGNRQSSSGQNITFNGSSDTIQDMASEALKNSINIPPTGYINQGAVLNIIVARDIDFSHVYERVNPFRY